MYDNDSSVTITGVQGDRSNSIRTFTVGTVSGTGVLSGTPYTVSNGTASGNGSGEIFDITLSDTNTNISNITINNPSVNFAVGETITIRQDAVGGSGASTFATLTVTGVEDSLGGIPISKINTTS